MSEQLYVCDHAEECPKKCPHGRITHGRTVVCKSGKCAMVEKVVQCIPVPEPATEREGVGLDDWDGHPVQELSDIISEQLATIERLRRERDGLRAKLDDAEREIIRRIDTAVKRDGQGKQLRKEHEMTHLENIRLRAELDELKRLGVVAALARIASGEAEAE